MQKRKKFKDTDHSNWSIGTCTANILYNVGIRLFLRMYNPDSFEMMTLISAILLASIPKIRQNQHPIPPLKK